MSKYNRAFKLKLAQLVQVESSGAISLKFNVQSSLIRYWAQVYELNGIDSFTHKRLPYTCEFKLSVLKTMEQNNWSLHYTSAFFDLSSPGILFKWQKLYSSGGMKALKPQRKGSAPVKDDSSKPKPSEQMTEKELREELEYLRAENAVLKKLEALAQAQKKKVKKRP